MKKKIVLKTKLHRLEMRPEKVIYNVRFMIFQLQHAGIYIMQNTMVRGGWSAGEKK